MGKICPPLLLHFLYRHCSSALPLSITLYYRMLLDSEYGHYFLFLSDNSKGSTWMDCKCERERPAVRRIIALLQFLNQNAS